MAVVDNSNSKLLFKVYVNIKWRSRGKYKPRRGPKKVKDGAKIIRETSPTARNAVRKFHESGAVSELAVAVQEAAVAAQDTGHSVLCRTSYRPS
ncbi:MAG TPA: hypothetical protein VEL11_14865 [Candidatus Bathyarchaeia archaeon]|nr:hypothetical protein [Candidatus Bathyarchaeia archaeon]